MVKHFPYGSWCRLEATPGLVDPHSGKLLGGVNLAIEGGEILATVQLATMKNPP